MSEHQPDSPRQRKIDYFRRAITALPQGPLPESRAGEEGSARRPDHPAEQLFAAIRASRKHAHAPRPRPCGAGGLASFVHGVLLNTGLAASAACRHTGRVRGGPRPLYVPCFASPRRPRVGGPGPCIRRRGGIEPLRVSTPHELKSCHGTSPTHPGSGNPILPGMPHLLHRNGRFPQAGRERRDWRGSARPVHHCFFSEPMS